MALRAFSRFSRSQIVDTSSLDIKTDSSTTSETGNDVTGDNAAVDITLRVMSSSSSETNQTQTVTRSVTSTVSDTSQETANDLRAGDLLRNIDGTFTTVTDVFDAGEVKPVFNIRVRGNHTYHVTSHPDVPPVLVHNESISVRGDKVFWNVEQDGVFVDKDVASYEIGTVKDGQVQLNENFGGGEVSLDKVQAQASGYWNAYGYLDKSGAETQQSMIGNALQRVATKGTVAEGAGASVAGEAVAGLGTGGKAVVNGLGKAAVSTATLGQVEGGNILNVTEADRARGYDTAEGFAQAGGEVLIGAASGGGASLLAKGGKAAKVGSYALRAYDAAGNAVDVVGGANDIRKNGLTVQNTLRVAGGALGTVGDAAGLRKGLVRGPKATPELARKVADAAPVPLNNKRTVAVIETREGKTLTAGGMSDLSDTQKNVARGEGLTTVPDQPDLHAELTGISGAAEMGLKPRRGVTTNKICPDCRQAIEDMGGKITGPRSFEFPEDL